MRDLQIRSHVNSLDYIVPHCAKNGRLHSRACSNTSLAYGEIGPSGELYGCAIVGNRPAGFYAADALIGVSEPQVQVDMFEPLASPFGLTRSGVAAKHPKLKQPIRADPLGVPAG